MMWFSRLLLPVGVFLILTPDLSLGIINGSLVDIKKSPFLASMEMQNSSGAFVQECGSVIVDKLYIITCAHCLIGYKPSQIRIRVGVSNRDVGGAIYYVDAFWYHQKFREYNTSAGSYLDYDIGVARLKKPIEFGESVAPAKLLAVNKELPGGTKAIAVGWGILKYTLEKGAGAVQLHRAVRSIIERQECDKIYRARIREPVSARFICTKTRSKAFCFGDSGGPLFERQTRDVAGIISWGTCGVLPDVYTDVANLEIRTFIREKTGIATM